jgi:hypothetical protein
MVFLLISSNLDCAIAATHNTFLRIILNTLLQNLGKKLLRNWYFAILKFFIIIIKRVSWFKSSLLLRIQSDSFTNINS